MPSAVWLWPQDRGGSGAQAASLCTCSLFLSEPDGLWVESAADLGQAFKFRVPCRGDRSLGVGSGHIRWRAHCLKCRCSKSSPSWTYSICYGLAKWTRWMGSTVHCSHWPVLPPHPSSWSLLAQDPFHFPPSALGSWIPRFYPHHLPSFLKLTLFRPAHSALIYSCPWDSVASFSQLEHQFAEEQSDTLSVLGLASSTLRASYFVKWKWKTDLQELSCWLNGFWGSHFKP